MYGIIVRRMVYILKGRFSKYQTKIYTHWRYLISNKDSGGKEWGF